MVQVLEKPRAEAERPAPAAPVPPEGFRVATRYLLTLASFVVVIAGLKAASVIVVPLMLAVFIAIIGAPVFLGMQQRGVPSIIALLVMVALLVGIGLMVGWIVDRALFGLGDKLGTYREALEMQIAGVRNSFVTQGLPMHLLPSMEEAFNPELLLGAFGPIAGRLGELLAQAFIILIVVVFILLEASVLPAKVRALPGLSRIAWHRIVKIVANVRRYVWLKTVMSLLTGATVAVFLAILGVDFPILLGFLAFALNYVPNIGSFVASLPGILLAFIEFGLGTALIVAVGYVIINVGISNGIEPRYMGYDLGVSPLIVLTSVILWGWILGPVGMLLSVPLTMTLKIALESEEDTRWIALLMGTKPPRSPPARRATGTEAGT